MIFSIAYKNLIGYTSFFKAYEETLEFEPEKIVIGNIQNAK